MIYREETFFQVKNENKDKSRKKYLLHPVEKIFNSVLFPIQNLKFVSKWVVSEILHYTKTKVFY